MASLNSVSLIGNLGKDPEIKTTTSGQHVANFSIATTDVHVKDGQKVENTEWHRIVAWGKIAELCGKFLKKGSSVYLQGKLQTRKWTNKEGKDQYTTEIIAQGIQFLDKKQKSEREQSMPQDAQDFDLSDIPF